jgi:hypothetical protein
MHFEGGIAAAQCKKWNWAKLGRRGREVSLLTKEDVTLQLVAKGWDHGS